MDWRLSCRLFCSTSRGGVGLQLVQLWPLYIPVDPPPFWGSAGRASHPPPPTPFMPPTDPPPRDRGQDGHWPLARPCLSFSVVFSVLCAITTLARTLLRGAHDPKKWLSVITVGICRRHRSAGRLSDRGRLRGRGGGRGVPSAREQHPWGGPWPVQ